MAMIPAQKFSSDKFLSLSEASEMLQVSVETLLEWNDSNILKPTITQDGKVGYRQGQIDKFLSIQQLSLTTITNSQSAQANIFATHPNTVFTENITVNTNIPHDSSPVDSNTLPRNNSQKNKSTSFALTWSSIVLSISLLVIMFTQQISPSFISDDTLLTNTDVLSNPSNIDLTNSNDPSILSSAHTVYNDTQSSSKEIASEDRSSAIRFLGLNPKIASLLDKVETNGTKYSLPANFTSRPNTTAFLEQNTSDSSENKGNNKGEIAANDLFTSAFGSPDISQNKGLAKQVINPSILLAFLTLGFLSLVLVLKIQPAYTQSKPNISTNNETDITKNINGQKIIEIDQKTDGTIVLYFQNDEYKVSKPELSSESDQFIERLLSFANRDVKEINYDISKDASLSLNAPLSKLVTRLGFVGLKRELFFPRTSKNSVLFRRYITSNDLQAMGVNANKITEELTN
jgi:hypothetical protein